MDMAAWLNAGLAVAVVPQITVTELKDLLQQQPDLQVLDVRRAPEYVSGHVPRAIPEPLIELNANVGNLKLDVAKPTAVICAGGYRSSAATSILQQHGFTDLRNVTGGTGAWIKAGYEVE